LSSSPHDCMYRCFRGILCLKATCISYSKRLVFEGANWKLPAGKTLLQLLALYTNPKSHNAQCYRDAFHRDRDETETLIKCVSRPSRDRDVETETTSWYHSRPPMPPFPYWRSPKNPIAITSGTDKFTDFKFGRYINSAHANWSPLKFWRKGSMGVSSDYLNFLVTPYYLRNR